LEEEWRECLGRSRTGVPTHHQRRQEGPQQGLDWQGHLLMLLLLLPLLVVVLPAL
jgi:hypothetical protein